MAAGGSVAASTSVSPTIWHLLGYSFEAASMCAGIGAAVITRAIIGIRGKTVGRATDWAVLCLVLLFTAVIIASSGASLLTGLLYGTGIAAIGESLIVLAEKWANAALTKFGIPPARPDDVEAIGQALRDTYQIPDEKDVS